MTFSWTPRSLSVVSPDRRFVFMGSTGDLDFVVYDVAMQSISGRIEEDRIPRLPLTDEEIEQCGATVRARGKVYRAHDFDQPEYLPLIKSAFCDWQGHLWVLLNARKGTPEINYLVFDRHGKKKGRLTVANDRVFQATGSHHWCFDFDRETEDAWIKKIAYDLK